MPQPEEVYEELTAYLDGELDDAARHHVEERLKHDAAYRAKLARFERTWDILDELDRASVGDEFTRTTMELVAVAAAEDVRQGIPRLPYWRLLAVAVAVVVVSGVGFAAGRWIWPNPNPQLLRDLPILQNIDMYDQGESADFLRKLEHSGLFDEEPEHG